MADKSDHRIALESRAKELGVDFTWNLGDDKLERRIAEAEAGGEAVPSSHSPSDQAKLLVIVVTGPKRGRWRCGRHFTHTPVVIALDEVSDEEQAALIADPRLRVETREAD